MFQSMIRQVSIFLDRIVYGFLEHIFQLIMDLANFQLFTSKTISSFANRIYLILGLVMVFKLMVSFIQILIDPNKMDDKEQGLGGILKRVIISLVLIVLVPSIFDLARRLQNEILPVIPKVVLGVKADMSNEDITNSAGQVMSYYSFLPFFYYADEVNCNTGVLAGTGSDNPTISRVGDISTDMVTEKKCSSASDGYTYRYQAFISTIAGAYLVYVLITIAVKIAIRAIKFSLCEIIAPIPIASYIDPKQSKESFDNWVKTSTKVYIDLFVRLAVVYFIIYIFQLLFNGENGSKLQETIGQYGFDRGLLVILFIIVGLLNFAKEMPKFVSDMLGMKDGFSDIGDMFKGAGWRQLGTTLGGAAGMVSTPISTALSNYNYSKLKGEDKKKFGKLEPLRRGIGGFFAGAGRSAAAAAQGKGWKGTKEARDTTYANSRRHVNTAMLRQLDKERYDEEVKRNGGSARGITPPAGSIRGIIQDNWHEFSGIPLPTSETYSQAASLMKNGKSDIFNQAKTKVAERPDLIKDAIQLKDADGKKVELTQNIYDKNGNVVGTRLLRDTNGKVISSAKFSDVYDAYKAMQEGRKVTTAGFENMSRSQLEAIYGNVWKDAAAKYVDGVHVGTVINESMKNAIDQWQMKFDNDTIITTDDANAVRDAIKQHGYGNFFKSSDDVGAGYETKAMRLKATEEAKKGDKS